MSQLGYSTSADGTLTVTLKPGDALRTALRAVSLNRQTLARLMAHGQRDARTVAWLAVILEVWAALEPLIESGVDLAEVRTLKLPRLQTLEHFTEKGVAMFLCGGLAQVAGSCGLPRAGLAPAAQALEIAILCSSLFDQIGGPELVPTDFSAEDHACYHQMEGYLHTVEEFATAFAGARVPENGLAGAARPWAM